MISARNRLLRAIPLLLVGAGIALVLTACPPVISPDLANVVQDTIAPIITITSPGDNSSFRSMLTVRGTVTDSSKATDDGLGVLESISFEFGGEEHLSRTLIFSDDGITFDPPELDFTYDEDTGVFEITCDTVGVAGFHQITISATDEKGQVSEESITVFAYTEGPYVHLDYPEDGPYQSVVRIEGRVTDGPGLTTTGEVDPEGLYYLIAAERVEIPVFDDRGTTGEYFDPSTGEFVIDHAFNPMPFGGVTLKVAATDWSGYEGSVTRSLVDQPRSGLEFTSPGSDTSGGTLYYYSSDVSSAAAATITVQGTPFEPGEVDSIVWDVVGGYTIAESPSGYGTGQPAFSFNVDLSPATSGDGDVSIRIRSTDFQSRVSSYTFLITDDPDGPTVSGNLFGINDYVEVTFNEPVWGGLNQTGALEISDFVTDAPNGAPTITGITILSGDLVNGFDSVRLDLSFGAGDEPDEDDELEISPAVVGTPPVDKANNEWIDPVVFLLSDERQPTVAAVDIVSDPVGGLNRTTDWYVNDEGLDLDTVEFEVTFSEIVEITGNHRLNLDLDGIPGGDGIYAYCTSPIGTQAETHTFAYDVAAGHNTAPGVYLDYGAGNLDENGSAIIDRSAQVLIPGLPDPALPANDLSRNVVVDTNPPVIGTTSATITARGGAFEVPGWINGGNTSLEVNMLSIPVATDPSLAEGRVVVFADAASLDSDVTPGDSDITASALNFDIAPANLQTTIPVTADFTLKLFDAAGNESTTSLDLVDPTVDYLPPGVAGGVTATATGLPVVTNRVNLHNTNIHIDLTGVPVNAYGGRAELFIGGQPLDPRAISGIIPSDGTASFDMLTVPSAAGVQAELDSGNNVFKVKLSDPAGNVGDLSTASDTLNADFQRPTITTLHSLDNTSSGDSETLEVQFSENVDDSTALVAGAWYMRHTDAGLSDIFLEPGVFTDVSSIISNSGGDNQYLRLTLTPVNIVGTAEMQTYVAENAIRDMAGNGILAVGWTDETVTDKARPVVIDALSLEYNSTDGNVNRLEIEFSEKVNDDSVDTGDNGWSMQNKGTSNPDVFDAFYTIVLEIAGVEIEIDHDQYVRFGLTPVNIDGTGEMEINIAAGSVTDLADPTPANANGIAAVSDYTVRDGAVPRVKTGHNLDLDSNGASETLEIEFTEPIDDSSVVIRTGVDPAYTYYWHMQVDQVGSEVRVQGDFTSLQTAVTTYTDVDPGTDDQYLRFTLTPPANSVGTGDMDVSIGVGVFTDLAVAANANEALAWLEVDDRADAVLIGAVSDDKSPTGLFNKNNDKLQLIFSEDLGSASTWNKAALEAVFTFGGVTTDDGDNFHSNLGVSLNSDKSILEIKQLSDAGASGTLIDVNTGLTTVAIAANQSGSAELRGADGRLVHAPTVTPPSFSVVGSSGTGGGGVVIRSIGGVGGADADDARPAQTVLLPPLSQAGGGAAVGGQAAPYVAPAVARLAQTGEGASDAAARQTSTPRPPAVTQSVPDEAALKIASAPAKTEAPRPIAAGAAAEGGGGMSTEAPPPAVAQRQPADSSPATLTSPRGAESTTSAVTSAGASSAGRSSTAAILALIAVMVILAGAALMVLSRLGRSRAVAKDKSGESRAE